MSDVIQSTTIEPAAAAVLPAPAPAPAMPTALPAPVVVTSDAPSEISYNETVQIGTITANSGFDPLSIVFVGTPATGTLSLDADGDVLYTAPANVAAGEADSFTYEIENSAGGLSAPVTNDITLDPGPTASDPNLILGHASTLDLSAIVDKLATPGLSGDTLTVTAVSAENGTIFQNSKNGDLLYKPVANGGAAPFGDDSITYTVWRHRHRYRERHH